MPASVVHFKAVILFFLVLLSLSYTFTTLATIHHDSSRCDLHCKIGMHKVDKTENSENTKVSHNVPTVSLRIHYSS